METNVQDIKKACKSVLSLCDYIESGSKHELERAQAMLKEMQDLYKDIGAMEEHKRAERELLDKYESKDREIAAALLKIIGVVSQLEEVKQIAEKYNLDFRGKSLSDKVNGHNHGCTTLENCFITLNADE